jgi:hypothetical protein
LPLTAVGVLVHTRALWEHLLAATVTVFPSQN